ncbi:MAG: ABC transporter ATP-binding protein [Verrucomicrobia bacterium]|nr:ABC transporter ATP-binding protein [Verrucomicrobiota bacterium]
MPSNALPWWYRFSRDPLVRRRLGPLLAIALALVAITWLQAYCLLRAATESQTIVDMLLPGRVTAGGRDNLTGSIFAAGLILAGYLIGASAITVSASWLRTYLQQELTNLVQARLLKVYSQESFSVRVARQPGATLKTFANDASGLSAMIVFGAVGLGEAVLRLSVYSFGLFALPHGWIIWLVLGGAAVILQTAVSRLFLRWERKAHSEADELNQQWFARAARYFEVLTRLLYFSAEKVFSAQLLQAGRSSNRARRRANLIVNSREAVTGILGTLSFPLCVLLLLGATGISAGEIVQAQILSNLFLGSLTTIVGFPAVWRQNQPSWRRVRQLIEQLDPGPEPAALLELANRPIAPRVELTGIDCPIGDPPTTVLREINLVVPAGAWVGLVGASGSGKTSLALLLVGDLAPSAGRVLVDNFDVTAWPLIWRRQLVSYLPAELQFLDASVRENIRLGRDVSESALQAAIEQAGLSDLFGADRLTLDHPIRSLAGEGYLSLGQRRRLGLAQVLLSHQRIVVLDEPTASLDPETGARLALSIRKALQNRTVVVATHQPELFETDFNLFLDAGRPVAVGTHKELLQSQPAYGELLRIGNGT